MSHTNLLPALRDVLTAIRQKTQIDDAIHILLEKACLLAGAAHGSFVRINHVTGRLNIVNAVGSDWTPGKLACQLRIGQGITGKVAATGQPYLCADTRQDPDYYPLFDYVRSELVVPVIVNDETWGLINIDGPQPCAFEQQTLNLLSVFAEMTSFAITLHLEMAEQEKLHQRLLQSEKLASLGEAIAGIAHEINNPLTSILINASLLELDHTTAKAHESARAIVTESQRAASLVKGLLEFSRRDTGQRETIVIGELIHVAIAVRRSHPQRGNVHYEYIAGSENLLVEVSIQQLQQVLLNLFTNAEHAISLARSDGVIRIETYLEQGVVHLRITDNGHGIPKDIQCSIFDPFFTTKAPGDGTGLGLSIAHTIMTAHGGAVHLAESSTKGTTFVLTLPLASASRCKPPVPVSRNLARGQLDGRVLIVDDEPYIADTLQTFLRHMRIEVRRAYNAHSAMDILRSGPVDLILSDIQMPDMDGVQFYEAARKLDNRYTKNFLFMSGYAPQDPKRSDFSIAQVKCIQKPFTLDELHQMLSNYLRTVDVQPSKN